MQVGRQLFDSVSQTDSSVDGIELLFDGLEVAVVNTVKPPREFGKGSDLMVKAPIYAEINAVLQTAHTIREVITAAIGNGISHYHFVARRFINPQLTVIDITVKLLRHHERYVRP